MPSVSKKQQKFMGIVRSIQKGDAPAGKFSKAAQKAAKSMKKGSVKKYAKTKHDDLPTKKIKEGAYKSATKNELAQYIINLKTFYDNVVMQTLVGGPLTGNTPPLGQQGMMLKMMADGFMKQPLQPGLSFTMEKLLADLDTKLTVIVDGDPNRMVNVPDTEEVIQNNCIDIINTIFEMFDVNPKILLNDED